MDTGNFRFQNIWKAVDEFPAAKWELRLNEN